MNPDPQEVKGESGDKEDGKYNLRKREFRLPLLEDDNESEGDEYQDGGARDVKRVKREEDEDYQEKGDLKKPQVHRPELMQAN